MQPCGCEYTGRRLVLIGVVAAFGIGVDAVHSALLELDLSGRMDPVIGLLEDGGELISFSLVAAFACALLVRLWTNSAAEKPLKGQR